MKIKITILAAVVGLLGTLPTHAFESRQNLDGLTVNLALNGNPVGVGSNEVRVTLTDTSGKKIANAKVTFYFGMMPMANMPPMNYKARLDESGGLYSAPVEFSMKGHWNLKVRVKTPDGKSRSMKTDLMVK